MPDPGRVGQQQGYLPTVPGRYGVAVLQLHRLGEPGHDAVPLMLVSVGHQYRLPGGLLQNILQDVQLVGMKLMGDVVLVVDGPARDLQQLSVYRRCTPGVYDVLGQLQKGVPLHALV